MTIAEESRGHPLSARLRIGDHIVELLEFVVIDRKVADEAADELDRLQQENEQLRLKLDRATALNEPIWDGVLELVEEYRSESPHDAMVKFTRDANNAIVLLTAFRDAVDKELQK